MSDCPTCHGMGGPSPFDDCPNCDGGGRIGTPMRGESGEWESIAWRLCPTCEGEGDVGSAHVGDAVLLCPDCGGTKVRAWGIDDNGDLIDVPCDTCDGERRVPDDSCSRCSGHGVVMRRVGLGTEPRSCPVCDGHGHQWADCPDCGGTGKADDPLAAVRAAVERLVLPGEGPVRREALAALDAAEADRARERQAMREWAERWRYLVDFHGKKPMAELDAILDNAGDTC